MELSMENEEQVQPVESAVAETVEVQEQAPAQDARDFERGFAQVAGTEVEPEPKPEEISDAMLAKLTEKLGIEGLREKIAEVETLKARDSKVFGSLGALKQRLDVLQSAGQQAKSLSEDDFEELKAEYPEFAPMLVAGLNRALGGRAVAANPPQQEPAQEQARPTGPDTALVRNMQDELTMRHEDWRDVVQSPGYAAWKGSLSPARQQIADNSWSVGAVAALLDDYKAALAAPKKTRQERLEAAIAPKGAAQPTPAQTAEDAFVAGFNSVRRRG